MVEGASCIIVMFTPPPRALKRFTLTQTLADTKVNNRVIRNHYPRSDAEFMGKIIDQLTLIILCVCKFLRFSS